MFTLWCNAGVVPIANNSGGPKEDIVTPDLNGEFPGFLCTTLDEYADAIITLLSMEHGHRLRMAAAARKCAPVLVAVLV
jgi:alpha-1,2-mannosyltransferase